MVEYTIETLVHLYDSLNSQIDKVQLDLNDINRLAVSPVDNYAQESLKQAINLLEGRLNRLVEMRDSAERIIQKILSAEEAETND